MPNTFDWIEIRTGDIEQTARFYEGLFGWKVVNREEAEGQDYWIIDTGDDPRPENLRRGGLWLRPAGQPLGVVVYVLVADIAATLQCVVELGGTIITPRTAQGPAFRATFADPSGNVLGLWEERPAAP